MIGITVHEHTDTWSRRLFLRIWWRVWVRRSLAAYDSAALAACEVRHD